MKKGRLVTHGDTDGVVSGVIMYSIGNYSEVIITDYNEIDAKDEEKRFRFDEKDTVVDLPQPAINVKFWSDHHQTGMRYDKPCYDHLFDPSAKSCAGLLFKHFREKYPKLEKLEKLVNGTDIVDSASYRTPAETYDFSNYANMIRIWTMGGRWDYNNKCLKPLLIREIAKAKNWKKVLDNPLFKGQAVYNANQMKVYCNAIEKLIKLEGKVSVFEKSAKEKINGIRDRYYPFAKFPECIYGIAITLKSGKWGITFSENPFLKDSDGNHPNKLNLGFIAKHLRETGGGHKGIGFLGGLTTEEKDAVLKSLLDLLNKPYLIPPNKSL